MDRRMRFVFAIGLQLAILLIIIGFKLLVLSEGNEILLRIRPVDPRDPLRGDYLTFQYDISQQTSYQFQYKPIRNGDTVYVILEKEGKYHDIKYGQISKEKPSSGTFIKGTVSSGGETAGVTRDKTGVDTGYREIVIKYGIEEYFIPENTGLNFNPENKEVSAKVVVDDNGNAVLKQIYLDNKPWP